MLAAHTREIIKSTAPVLAEHGETITQHFYKRMFREEPDLKNIFNQAHQAAGDQPRALSNAVYAYALNIDQPEVLAPAIKRITHKHASLQITPDQYQIVGHHLLASIKEVLGDAATDEILKAWEEAYGELARILTDTEEELYQQAESAQGGWRGWRRFVIRRKEPESDEITSFYLYPADGGPVARFLPGQYISVKLFVPELGLTQPRQYSLSDAPNGEYLRISVKRESASRDNPGGLVSNLLHDQYQEGDEIEISPPFGDFMLHEDRDTPAVFISGGVGITPLLSMLNSLVTNASSRQVVFVHGARNSRVRAMKEFVQHATHNSDHIQSFIFLEQLSDTDKQGEDYDFTGWVDLNKIRDEILLPQADYYICGPTPFIRLHRDQLLALGVEPGRIHYEIFGSSVMED